MRNPNGKYTIRVPHMRYGIIHIMAINHMHDIIMMRINQRPNTYAR